MTFVSTVDLRRMQTRLFDRVVRGHERIIVRRREKNIGAIISIDDLERLQAMEDAEDIKAIDESMAEPGEDVPYEQVRKELGL
ncbi:MAG: type II toxin-antitoxin system prevent-host-death family antitoxin [Candidatus Sumerlaeota bacterium]|nr:type II toxin-antitoxin system prevent-host-death family antitoxin [Candidatus Sumerlaeota bacterium]